MTIPKCSLYCGRMLMIVDSQIRCFCPEYTYSSSDNNSCNPQCSIIFENSQNEYYPRDSNCICKNGYYNSSGRCVPKLNCQTNQQADYGLNRCICKEGYYRNVQNQCQINCSNIPNSQSRGDRCYCKQNYQNISGTCTRICYEENKVQQNGQCICISGFVEVDGICVEECYENSQLVGAYCQCLPGYERTGPKQCIIDCSYHLQGSIFDGQKCVCIRDDFVNVSGKCNKNCDIYPGLELLYNSHNSQQCVCKRGYKYISPLQCVQSDCSQTPNTQLRSGYCECIDGFVKINDECIRDCSSIPHSYVDNSICSCLSGYLKINGQCVQQCLFTKNSRKQGNNCVCLEGYQNISGHCIKRCQLILNSQLLDNQCRCKSGYQNISGYCMILPNITTNCSTNSSTNSSTNPVQNCQLIPHSQLVRGQCLCQAGFINVSGICILNCSHICHSYVNQAGDTCVCADNYVMNSEGTKCLLDCSKTLFSEPDQSNSKCVCIEGYLHVKDCCVKDCSHLLHSHPDQTGSKCVCSIGYTFCKETQTCVQK